MKTFSSVLALLVAFGAIALSGFTYFKVSSIETQLSEQVALSPSEPNPVSSASPLAASDPESDPESNTTEDQADNTPANTFASTPIEPGQFSAPGYQGAIQIELVSVERLSDTESGSAGIVNVSMRVKRLVTEETVFGDGYYNITFYDAKGRSARTNAVYKTEPTKHTSTTHVKDLSSETWAEAYFWLKEVPEGVQTLDIVFPETAIFEDIPISG